MSISFPGAVLCALFLMPGMAFAAEPGLKMSGFLETGYWSGSRSLDSETDIAAGRLAIKATGALGAEGSLLLDTRFANADLARGRQTHGQIREGYFRFGKDQLDIQIGKQIVTWGRADRLNPTDNLTPRDFTLLVADDSEQRRGATVVRGTYYLEDVALTAVLLPVFRPNVIPFRVPAAIGLRETIPAGSRQWAVKLDQTGRAIDWSVSYFSGFDLNPDLSLEVSGPYAGNLCFSHNPIQVLGADAATTVGAYGIRAEAAYTWTEQPVGRDFEVKRPFLYLVVGAERKVWDDFNVNVQLFFRSVSNYRNPYAIADPSLRSVAVLQAVLNHQLTRRENGMTFLVSRKWLNETLAAEIAAVYSFTQRDFLLRPRMSYAFSDHWRGSLGVDRYRGGENTFFGRLKANSAVFAELAYGF